MRHQGLSAAPGFARGRIVKFVRPVVDLSEVAISESEVAAETARFFSGRNVYAERLRSLHQQSRARGDQDEADILDGHLELLLDEELANDITARIAGERCGAAKAAALVLDGIIAEMGALENQYARERAADFSDLKTKLIAAIATGVPEPGLSLTKPGILVGRDLSPADTASLDKAMLLGIICETGGVTSHVAIISQNLGIPAVVGLKGALAVLGEDEEVLLNGTAGTVIATPTAAEIADHLQAEARQRLEQTELARINDCRPATRDGVHVKLYANIGGLEDVEPALRWHAEGVGLFRTEFLFMNRSAAPAEEEQYLVYRKVATRMGGRSVIIRTLDAGGDKPLPYLSFPAEENPFLGLRGMRVYKSRPELFRSQVRAVLRASSFGQLKLMVPMVISVEEARWFRGVVAESMAELRAAGIPFDEKMESGIMIETPAAVLVADELAREVDFFSIGSNDLTQYTLAVDRGNESIAGLYDAWHPAVVRQIGMVVAASHRHGKWTGICGELAGDARAAVLLHGLGVDELSMNSGKIPHAKRALAKVDSAEARALAAAALRCSTSAEVLALFSRF